MQKYACMVVFSHDSVNSAAFRFVVHNYFVSFDLFVICAAAMCSIMGINHVYFQHMCDVRFLIVSETRNLSALTASSFFTFRT